MGHYCASDHKAWAEAGLKDYGDFAESVEFVNQSKYGDGQLEGEWYFCDDETLTIYSGSFGNYNSPGADSYTYADVYDELDEYNEAKDYWDACDEFVEDEYEYDEEEFKEDEDR